MKTIQTSIKTRDSLKYSTYSISMMRQTLSDKNFFLEIHGNAFSDFIEFERIYGDYFHEKLRFAYFDAAMGEFIELEGRNRYFEFMNNLIGIYDFIIDDVVISEDKAMIFLFYQQIVTEKSPYYKESLPPMECLAIYYIENNQFVRIKPMLNTFQVLKYIGKAVFQSEDRDRINQYLENLIKVGILDSSQIKLNRNPNS